MINAVKVYINFSHLKRNCSMCNHLQSCMFYKLSLVNIISRPPLILFESLTVTISEFLILKLLLFIIFLYIWIDLDKSDHFFILSISHSENSQSSLVIAGLLEKRISCDHTSIRVCWQLQEWYVNILWIVSFEKYSHARMWIFWTI